MSLEFILTSLVVILLPGTGVFYTLAIGLGRGWRESTIAAFGCTLGILPHLAASLLGAATLLHASVTAFEVLKFAGVIYLMYLAWDVLRAGGSFDFAARATPASAMRIIRDAVLLNALNPKLSLFFFAFLPQFIAVTDPTPTLSMTALGLVFMLLTFVVFCLYGAFAAASRRFILGRPAVLLWMRRSFALAFGLLGLRLALAGR